MIEQKKYFQIFSKFFALFLFLTFSVGCATQKAAERDVEETLFRFVFAGDSRGDYKADPPVFLQEEPLIRVRERILELTPRPELVIFNGDMVAKTAYTKSISSADRWKEIFMAPILEADIKFYLTPGNHIIDQKKADNSIKPEYITLFNRLYAGSDNPGNGPDGYQGVTFSFTHLNTHFVTTTSFISHDGPDNTEVAAADFVQKKKLFEYFVNQDNRLWLINDLARDSSDFTIYFTHCPIYPVGPHNKDRKSLHAHVDNRDRLAKILTDDKVDAYLTSHEHLYARAHLGPDNPKSSHLQDVLPQLVIGSAGAPIKKKPAREDIVFEKYEFEFNFLVADVKTSYIDCHVYDDLGKEIDTFIISKK